MVIQHALSCQFIDRPSAHPSANRSHLSARSASSTENPHRLAYCTVSGRPRKSDESKQPLTLSQGSKLRIQHLLCIIVLIEAGHCAAISHSTATCMQRCSVPLLLKLTADRPSPGPLSTMGSLIGQAFSSAVAHHLTPSSVIELTGLDNNAETMDGWFPRVSCLYCSSYSTPSVAVTPPSPIPR